MKKNKQLLANVIMCILAAITLIGIFSVIIDKTSIVQAENQYNSYLEAGDACLRNAETNRSYIGTQANATKAIAYYLREIINENNKTKY